jgi:hypothetical protein
VSGQQTLKFACSVAALGGIVYVHGFELTGEYVPVQLPKAYPEFAYAVREGIAPAKKLPGVHPIELAGEAVGVEAPPAP